MHESGCDYYRGLLAYRKMFWRSVTERVERHHGRTCPDTEWPIIVEHYSGVRGRLLSECGWHHSDDPGLFCGEELLFEAVLRALLTNSDTVILTSDPLLLDQFVKLCRLLTSHYQAYEFGRKILESPGMFRSGIVKAGRERQYPGTEGDAILYSLGDDWQSVILTPSPILRNIHFWLFQDWREDVCRFTASTYCAEGAILEMLKSRAGRINDFEGRSILIAADVKEPLAVVARHQAVTYGSRDMPDDKRLLLRVHEFSAVDYINVVSNCEAFAFPRSI
jgi:hypothetical protein